MKQRERKIMKVTQKFVNTVCACVLILAALPAVSLAQPPVKSATADSLNRQLQRGAKPAKTGVATAQSLADQANGKPKRDISGLIVPPTSNKSAAKSTAAHASTDSAKKKAPPVQRAAVSTKKKPPVK